ncbi:MAG: iron-containing alcohol dehydrogenase [Bacteroides sp.]|nr:iron-containing alcohol dehydrogenase [Bacteroides sp.]MBD5368827.1 iron-containing alcohol dehydrogenase [Bacteroides sp.]
MENFTFWTPTKYVFGRGVEMQAGQLTASMLARKVLIVYGGHSAEASGLLGRVRESLTEADVEWRELGGIRPNPTDDKVREGIEMMRADGLEALLAVGGGSVIDTAKAIAAGVPYEGDFWDFFEGKAEIGDTLPLGVILTIPAAGSEGSGNSVITKIDGKVKISIRTEVALRPKFALMNPELTFTLPPYQTACGIADMMAHIFERYFSDTPCVEITDRVAEGVLMAIIEEAPKVMANPTDYDARANIMWSGTLAHNGVCGTGRKEDWASHAMEHEISAVYDVAHGAGLSVVFPAWMTFMAKNHPEKGAQLARRIWGVTEADDHKAAIEGVMKLKQFFKDLGLPVTMDELGVKEPDIDLLVERLHRNKGAVIGGYYPLTSTETRLIYQLTL